MNTINTNGDETLEVYLVLAIPASVQNLEILESLILRGSTKYLQ